MKSLFGIIGLVAILLACSVDQIKAQTPTYGAQTLWSTNGATLVPAAAATTLNAVIDCRKQNTFALQVTAYGATGVAAGYFWMSPSVDGISYDSSQGKTVGITPTTSGATVVTNINSYGAGYWKITY